MASDYVDVRELLEGYRRFGCRDCDAHVWVPPHYQADDALCDEHAPDVDHLLANRREVRL